jgi:hypothetical protein
MNIRGRKYQEAGVKLNGNELHTFYGSTITIRVTTSVEMGRRKYVTSKRERRNSLKKIFVAENIKERDHVVAMRLKRLMKNCPGVTSDRKSI